MKRSKYDWEIKQFVINTNRHEYESYRKKVQRKRNKQSQNSSTIVDYGNKSSDILFLLFKDRGNVKKKRNRLTITVPSNFSIMDNPYESLKKIYAFIEAAYLCKKIEFLFFNYSDMHNFDLAAETLLAILCHEINRMDKNINFVGTYPPHERACRFIKSMGIIKELGVEDSTTANEEDERLEIFRKASSIGSSSSQGVGRTEDDVVIQQFARYLNNCLKRIGYQLTRESRGRICQYVSEIMNNIIEHSGMSSWRFYAYLDTMDSNLACEVTIVNFGKTISQSFERLDKQGIPGQVMQGYIDKHCEEIQPEKLTTVFALQGNVSSKNDESFSRGQGTVEYLSFFIDLNEELKKINPDIPFPKMVLLSGNTCISFDESVKIIKDEEGRKIIPLNSQGSLSYPPEDRYFHELETVNFPGTLISIKFNLPQEMIKES